MEVRNVQENLGINVSLMFQKATTPNIQVIQLYKA